MSKNTSQKMRSIVSKYSTSICAVGFGFLLLWHGILCLGSLAQKSLTFDEIVFIPSSFSVLKARDPRLSPVVPPFSKVVMGLPLLFMDVRFSTAMPEWIEMGQWLEAKNYFIDTGPENIRKLQSFLIQYQFGQKFFYELNKEKLQTIVYLARIPFVFLSLLTGYVLYRWSLAIYGAAGAIVTVTLYTFSPTIITHARLATNDFCFSALTLITAYCFWKTFVQLQQYEQFPWKESILTGLSAGLLLLTKFSGLFMLFFLFSGFFCGTLCHARSGKQIQEQARSGSFYAMVGRSLRTITFISGIAIVTIAGVYLLLFGEITIIKQLSILYSRLALDPNYKYYLCGEFGTHFYSYFLWTVLLKSTVSELIFGFIGIILGLTIYRSSCRTMLWFSLVPALLFFGTASIFFPNLSHRYVLCIYPLMFLMSGIVSKPFTRWPILTSSTVLVILVFHCLSSLRTYPDYIPYFNCFIGDQENAVNYLDDSNVDWGQGLIQLKEFVTKEGIEQITVSYSDGRSRAFFGFPTKKIDTTNIGQYQPGQYFAVSAHLVSRTLYTDSHGKRHRFWDQFQRVALVGGSIHIYRFIPVPVERR
ncbi:ArnT family glycosyltransferase [candidate division CSSED10-310 bacterium]|uniref:ArnT family glycosyltransferase n=1 Tax=candidate division CSSED10-310 bacterium TaxID=2855610 RepID=A0ABV6YYL0_UNCC1